MSASSPSLSSVSVLPGVKHLLGEGARWYEGTFWWIDIEAGELWCLDAAGRPQAVLKRPHQIGSFAYAGQGRFVLATRLGFELFESSTGTVHFLCNPQANDATRFNDGRVDAAGRFWAGTMALDPARYGDPLGVLYCLTADGRATEKLSGLTISNGLDWSTDQSTMYLNDTMRGVTWAFDFDVQTGSIARQRVFADLKSYSGLPDGLLVDAQDHVWIAMIGGRQLLRFKPDGVLDTCVALPTTWPTALAFGGTYLTDLCITTSLHLMTHATMESEAGAVLMMPSSPWQGRPEHLFRLEAWSNKP